MANGLTLALRFGHILFGIAWIGAIFLMGLLIFPRVEKAGGPFAGTFIMTYAKPLSVYGEVTSLTTIVLGLSLYSATYGFSSLWNPSDAHARVYLLALVLAIIIMLLGAGILFPRMRKAARILAAAPPGPPPPEVPALLKPLPYVSMAGLALSLVVVALMVIGQTGAYA